MSKTYQYSGLTEELYQRLVSEHASLKKAHKKALISSSSKRSSSVMNYKLVSFIKRLIVQWWSVRESHLKQSIG